MDAASRQDVLRTLLIDQVTAEVASRLELAGLGFVLLKGASFAAWLYNTEETRTYRDLDILVSPGAVREAEATLGALGFQLRLPALQGAQPWTGREWLRASDGATVDLHRSIFGVNVPDSVAWGVLSRQLDQVEVAGRLVPVLRPAARALHVAIHAGQDRLQDVKKLEDLRRALACVSLSQWGETAGVARQLNANQAFAAGLQRLDAGRQVARLLGLPAVTDVGLAIRAGGLPRTAAGLDWILRRPRKERLQLVWRKFFPPRAFLEAWILTIRRRPLPWLLHYPYRVGWLLTQAPRALFFWMRTRRRIANSDGPAADDTPIRNRFHP